MAMTQGHVKENTVASYFSPSVILYRSNQTGFPFLLPLGLDVLPAEREALTGGHPGVLIRAPAQCGPSPHS